VSLGVPSLNPSAAELAAGHRQKRKFSLAAEYNAASRKQAEKKIQPSRRKKYSQPIM